MYSPGRQTAARGTYQWAGAESTLVRAIVPEASAFVSPFPDRRRGLGVVSEDAAAGAAIGSVVPGIGTAVGGAVGAAAGLITSLFGSGGGNAAKGIPRAPLSPPDPAFAQALATKWYTLYLGRNPDADGLQHWIASILKDGPAWAWADFSGSPEPIANNVTQKAATYTPMYGGPLVLSASPVVPSSGNLMTPPPIGYQPPQSMVPQQASVLGSLTPTTLLLGAVLLGLGVALTRHGKSSS